MWSPSGLRHTFSPPPKGVPLQAQSSSIFTGPVYGASSSASLFGMALSGRQTNKACKGSVSVEPLVESQYPPAQ